MIECKVEDEFAEGLVKEKSFFSRMFDFKKIDNSTYTYQSAPVKERDATRTFGGQLIAQSLYLAGQDIGEGFGCNSLHAYFIRAGQDKLPFLFSVNTIRKGRSFCVLEVNVYQNNKMVFVAKVSFAKSVEGPSHQYRDFRKATEELHRWGSEKEAGANTLKRPAMFARMESFFPIEIRATQDFFGRRSESTPPTQNFWLRIKESANNSLIRHQSIFAYMTDMLLMRTSIRPHDDDWGGDKIAGASLDHTIHFHQSFAADQWLCFNMVSPVAGNGRGYQRAEVCNGDGEMLASVTQESLMRFKE